MKTLKQIILGYCLFLSINLIGQNSPVMVIAGIEFGNRNSSLVSSESLRNNLNMSGFHFGVNLEKPIYNKFSMGLGLLYSKFGKFNNYLSTGNTRYNERDVFEQEYQVYQHAFLRSFSTPIRFIYRLNCNCIYFQAAFIPAFIATDVSSSNQNNNIYTSYFEQPLHKNQFKEINKNNYSVEFGIGAKLHFTEKFRILLRVDYQKYIKPYFEERNNELPKGFTKITFGLQRAFYKKDIAPTIEK